MVAISASSTFGRPGAYPHPFQLPVQNMHSPEDPDDLDCTCLPEP